MLKSWIRNQKKLSAFLAYVSYCLILSWNSFHKYGSSLWFYGNIYVQNNDLRQCIVKCVELFLYYGEPDQWRIVAILEALKVRAGEMDLPEGWVREEFEEILEVACVN